MVHFLNWHPLRPWRLATILLFVVAVATTGSAQAPAGRPLPDDDHAVFKYLRLETDAGRSRGGPGEAAWNSEGWIGTDMNRAWWRTSGEVERGHATDAEAQLTYGRYVTPFWDALIGYRRVIRPRGGDYLVLGMQGLAPYRFEVAANLFIADRGRLSARTELDYELLWTQRLISRPGIAVDWLAAPDAALGQSAGIGDTELRFPTRYELSRRLAPYVEVRRTRRAGTRARLASEDSALPWSLRAGVWLLY